MLSSENVLGKLLFAINLHALQCSVSTLGIFFSKNVVYSNIFVFNNMYQEIHSRVLIFLCFIIRNQNVRHCYLCGTQSITEIQFLY